MVIHILYLRFTFPKFDIKYICISFLQQLEALHSHATDSLHQRMANVDPDVKFWRDTVTDAFANQLRHVPRNYSSAVLRRCLDIVDEFSQKAQGQHYGLITCAPSTFTSSSTTVVHSQGGSLPPAASLPGPPRWGLAPQQPSPNVTPRSSSTPSGTPLHSSDFLREFMTSASPAHSHTSQRSLHTPQMPEEEDI